MEISTLQSLFLFGLICLGFQCVKSNPTPPLPGTQTLMLVDHTVLLNPSTATYYTPSSSVYVGINSGCGGHLTNHSGQLTHPGYPNAITLPGKCTWKIDLDPGMRVSMFFNYLDLKGSCDKNFLEVWEVTPTGSRSMLKRYCGYLERPEHLVTKTDNIEVVFQSNSSISGGGFLVTYSQFSGCDHTFTNNSGMIQSPYYPDDYPMHIKCAYSINVPADHQISLSLEFLDLAYSLNCTEDVLEIWDGPPGVSSPIGRYCGYLFSQWIRSKGNVLSLTFTSDMTSARRGYKLKYYAVKSDCNGTLNQSKGFIASPNTHGICSWTINSLPGHVISLRFDRFFLKLSESCSRDYLVIKDEYSVIGRYCGYQKDEVIFSNGDSVTIEYVSTTADGNEFQIYYESFSQPDTYEYLNKTRGSLQSPLYPDKYPSNVHFSWTIDQPPGYVIDLMFDDFELEFSVNCTKDYIEVFDGPDNSSSSLGKFCGAKKPSDHVTTFGNVMYIEFASDNQRTTNGFRISYTGIKTDCPKNFTNSSGTITSPNYPDFYPKNYDCEWHISYSVGYQIYLTLTSFDIEQTESCSGDYVVFKGVTGVEEEDTFCGYIVKRYPLVSKMNTMSIVFHTDGKSLSRGFVLDYKVDGTGYPPAPRLPISNELEQAVKIELYNITKSMWITNKDLSFKKLIANATNVFCEFDNLARCRLSEEERQRRSLSPEFTMQSIHLAPGFPKEEDEVLVLVVYALYSNDMRVDRSWNSPALPQKALKDAISTSKDFIASSFGVTIKSISLFTRTYSTRPPLISTPNASMVPIILGVLGAFVVLFCLTLVGCLFWRKNNHGNFIVKRCVTPIEFVDENDGLQLERVKTDQAAPKPAPRRRASTLKVVDLEEEH